MKQLVRLSSFSVTITAIILIVLLGIIFLSHNHWTVILITCTLLLMCISALIYMPLSISVNEKELCINRPLRIKQIPLSDIVEVKMVSPTMAEKRIRGSGGWMGYWGWFSEKDLGKYFAYYGNSSDCFLIKLNNGRQYMLGCSNPAAIVSYIQARLNDCK